MDCRQDFGGGSGRRLRTTNGRKQDVSKISDSEAGEIISSGDKKNRLLVPQRRRRIESRSAASRQERRQYGNHKEQHRY
jgi:hypothetical protein